MQLALAIGADGYRLLEAVHAAGAPPWLAEIPAVEVLRIVWVQQYTRTGGEVIWREVSDLPPGRRRLTSPYDLDARYAGKRGSWWNGYKAHVTETCDDADVANECAAATGEDDGPTGELPRLITNVATTDATVTDVEMTAPIHAALAAKGLLPGEHVVDSGYASAELLVGSRDDYGVRLLGPLLADNSSQARSGGGFDRAAFTVDWDRKQATCPQGHHSSSWSACNERGRQSIVVRFAAATCRACPVRQQCTRAARTSTGRQLMLRPRHLHQAVQATRAEQATSDWKQRYAIRAGVEGTIHQAVAVTGVRRSRYVGLAKTHLAHVFAATAINLIRLDAWWTGHPLDRTRTSHLAALEPAA